MLRRLLTKNFHLVYRLDRWVKRRFTPTGMLLLGAIVGGGVLAVDTRRTLTYQLVMLALAFLGVAMVSALAFRSRFSAKRRLPRYATVGEVLVYAVRIRAHNLGSRRVLRGLTVSERLDPPPPTTQEFANSREPDAAKWNWFDRNLGYPRFAWLMSRHLGALFADAALPDVTSTEAVHVDMRLTPVRRGYIRLREIDVICPDPLGLFKGRAPIVVEDTLLVLPRRYPLPHLNLPGARRYQHGGVALAGSTGDSQEFVSLREYRPGDPLRHIHWRSFARVGEPVVKEFQDEFFVRHALVLDTFSTHRASERFEEAVRIAASLVCSFGGGESLLDLVFVGPEHYAFTVGRGITQTDRILEILACVEVCTDLPFERLPERVMANAAGLSGCVCVLLEWDAARQAFVAGLRRLGLPVQVFVIVDRDAPTTLDAGPMSTDPKRFCVLETGKIGAGLAALA